MRQTWDLLFCCSVAALLGALAPHRIKYFIYCFSLRKTLDTHQREPSHTRCHCWWYSSRQAEWHWNSFCAVHSDNVQGHMTHYIGPHHFHWTSGKTVFSITHQWHCHFCGTVFFISYLDNADRFSRQMITGVEQECQEENEASIPK